MPDRNGGINRRELLGMGLAGAAALGLHGEEGGAGRIPAAPLPERVLGRTGLKVTIVGMGVMNAELPELVRGAIEAGMRLLDTAAYYMEGRNEEMVGRAVKKTGLRDRIVLCTKAYLPQERRGEGAPAIRDFYLSSARESLRRLQTDRVEVFYSHNVSTPEYLNHPGVLEAMAQLKKEGKIRFAGFSAHANVAAMLREAARTGRYDVALVSFNYAFAGDAELLDALEACRRKGIGLVAMKTQCMQAWYKMNLPQGMQKYYEGTILHSALLKWVLRHDLFASAVPGFTTFPQMEEDAAAARDLTLSPTERRFLEDRGVKLALEGLCRQCGQCLPTCPKGADIPTLMRAHLYAASYRNFGHARATLREAAPGRGMEACSSCGACAAVCSRRVGVARAVDELRQLFA